ncbi:MAG: hypothetical protein J1E98_06670 [Lachnospiraceae bacterium]|nr:hypothetical protein [Lachnospiraceae bacterium]
MPLEAIKISEITKTRIDSINSFEDAVWKRLDDIRNMTPEQLRERMEESLSKKINADELVENADDLDIQAKIEKQDKEIANVENGNKTLENTQEKGNYGEMKTDQELREKGYERISKDMITEIDDIGHQGIDGVYYNPDGHPQYIIVDAKYGTAQLSDTLDGKQMSDNWIDKRLDESVGKEKADEIRMEKLLNPDNVSSYISHIDESGNVIFDKLDGKANIIEKDVKINES